MRLVARLLVGARAGFRRSFLLAFGLLVSILGGIDRGSMVVRPARELGSCARLSREQMHHRRRRYLRRCCRRPTTLHGSEHANDHVQPLAECVDAPIEALLHRLHIVPQPLIFDAVMPQRTLPHILFDVDRARAVLVEAAQTLAHTRLTVRRLRRVRGQCITSLGAIGLGLQPLLLLVCSRVHSLIQVPAGPVLPLLLHE